MSFPNPFEQQKWAKQQKAQMDQTYGVGPWGKSMLPQAQPFRDALSLAERDPQAYNRQVSQAALATQGQKLAESRQMQEQQSAMNSGALASVDPYRMLSITSPSKAPVGGGGGVPKITESKINMSRRINPFV